MAFFPDLGPCWYFGVLPGSRLRAVGWLEAGQPFGRGRVDAGVRRRLGELAEDPRITQVLPVGFVGSHACSLCAPSEPPHASHGEMVIPWMGDAFVSPRGILHTIDVHEYQPPAVFLTAVAECDPAGEAFRACARAVRSLFDDVGYAAGPARSCPFCRRELAAKRASHCHRCQVQWKVPNEMPDAPRQKWARWECAHVLQALAPLLDFVERMPRDAAAVRVHVVGMAAEVARLLAEPVARVLPPADVQRLREAWQRVAAAAGA